MGWSLAHRRELRAARLAESVPPPPPSERELAEILLAAAARYSYAPLTRYADRLDDPQLRSLVEDAARRALADVIAALPVAARPSGKRAPRLPDDALATLVERLRAPWPPAVFRSELADALTELADPRGAVIHPGVRIRAALMVLAPALRAGATPAELLDAVPART